MKKQNLLKIILLAAAALAVWSGLGGQEAQAAGTAKSKASYTIHTYSKRYGAGKSVTGVYKYQLPVLKGNTKAVKKINASLKKAYQASLAEKKGVAECVKASNQSGNHYKDRYFSTTTCKATYYNKKGYISFRFHHEWYVGGVHNGWTDGMTYNLKTGKKLNVSNVIAGNASAVKRKIINAYFKKYPKRDTSYAREELYSKKISDFQFYLKNGNVVVSFGAYSPGVGNGETRMTLKGNYR